MTMNPTLDSSDYTALRSTQYAGATYVSVLSNRTVYSGLVNGTPDTNSIVEIPIDTTTGSYSDVRPDMRVQVAVDADYENVVYDGRIRKIGGDGSTLFIAETARPIANNYRVRVLDDYPISPRKPRIVDGVFFVDYDLAFVQLPPLVSNVQSAYAGFTSGGVLTVAFAPTVAAAADGATISTYQWDVGDGTITTGTSSTQNITATFPAGERWVHFTVTDINGVSLTRHILVLAYDDTDDSGLMLAYETVTVDNRIEEGATASLTTYADVAGWLSRQLVVVWTTDNYGGTTTPIDNNIAFYGRRSGASDEARYDDTGGVDQLTRLDLDGTLAQLAEGIAFPATLDDVVAATAWFEVESLTVWRGMYTIMTRMTTAATIVSVSFDDTGDTYRIGDTDTQGATAWEQVLDLAQSLGATVQEGRDGALNVARYAVLLEEADDRLGVATVAAWTDADYFRLSLRDDDVDTVASVTVYAGSYNVSSGVTEAYQAIAPGEGYGTGANHFTDNRQIVRAGGDVLALFEARKRAGNLYARRQPVRELSVDHPDGYWWRVPAVREWVTFTVPDGQLFANGSLDTGTNWWCREVSVQHNASDGTRDVTATYVEETEGREGVYIPPRIVESEAFTPPAPIVFPEPEPGIVPDGLPMEDVDTSGGTGSFNSADDSVDDACSGGGAITVGGWDFPERCVASQGISLQYADLPAGTVSMVLSLNGATVKTSTWGLQGTQVLKAFDETFADSVSADRVDVSLSFSEACVDGTLRIFGVRVNEDTFSDGCQDDFPEIHDFGQQTLTTPGQIVELGSLPYDVVAIALRVDSLVAVPADCGFGRSGEGEVRANEVRILRAGVNLDQGTPTAYFERGATEFTQILVDAGLIPDAGVGSISVYGHGTVFQYRANNSTVNPQACYPIKVQAWAVVDLNSGE